MLLLEYANEENGRRAGREIDIEQCSLHHRARAE